MRIVIAPDSFKESVSAVQAAKAIAAGLRRALPEAELLIVPMADGGEGTVEALVSATAGSYVTLHVTGPLGAPFEARYGLLGDAQIAVIEMAAASGFALVPSDKRDPRITTTFGTGELLRDALDRGARRIIVGIGGSATNDAGAGMAQALGFSLRDAEGQELPRGGAALARLADIDASHRHSALDTCEVLVACDVTNPLCGEFGASRMYGPQKGATPAVALELDAALRRFAEVVRTDLGVDVLDVPGAGAAGGLGAGLVAFARGLLRPGVEIVAEACGLEARIRDADLVITGEGKLDAQTVHGKTPSGVAHIAKRHRVPVIAIAGTLGEGYAQLYEQGLTAAFSICPGPIPLADALQQGTTLIENVAENAGRMWRAALG